MKTKIKITPGGDQTSAPAGNAATARAELESWYQEGEKHYHGKGVPQDYMEAVKWWRRAAEQGHASAQFKLSDCLRKGRGVPRDQAEAIRWYCKAAEQGDLSAQRNVALLYQEGYGVPQDHAEAERWDRMAAETQARLLAEGRWPVGEPIIIYDRQKKKHPRRRQ